MEKQAKVGKILSALGVKKLPSTVRKGFRKSMEGEIPFLLVPFKWGASKLLGEKAVNKAVYKSFQRPIAALDIGAGQILQKGLGKVTKRGKHFFADKKILPIGKEKGIITGGQEVYIPSALAPVSKAGKFVIPTLGAMKLEEMVRGDNNMSNQKLINEADLRKTAAMLEGLNEERNKLKKEAKATELLYKQAELGQIRMPKTFAEYQEKVAELLGKDLDVVEEAIKIAASSENELGGLDDSTRIAVDPRTAFQQSILD